MVKLFVNNLPSLVLSFTVMVEVVEVSFDEAVVVVSLKDASLLLLFPTFSPL